ncbi:DotI/IcmL family type IV secretion protein [Escherichia coli]
MDYREQINARQDSFSDEEFVSYYNALVSSGILEKVKEKRMNLSVLTSSGIIQSKGVLDNGHYAWRVQYPITLRLNGQSTSLPPQNFILTMMIETADPRSEKGRSEHHPRRSHRSPVHDPISVRHSCVLSPVRSCRSG